MAHNRLDAPTPADPDPTGVAPTMLKVAEYSTSAAAVAAKAIFADWIASQTMGVERSEAPHGLTGSPIVPAVDAPIVSLSLVRERLRIADTIREYADQLRAEADEMTEYAQMYQDHADEVEAAALAGKRPRICIDRDGYLLV